MQICKQCNKIVAFNYGEQPAQLGIKFCNCENKESDLLFEKAIVLDFTTKTVWIYKEDKLKIYSKDYFDELVGLLKDRITEMM